MGLILTKVGVAEMFGSLFVACEASQVLWRLVQSDMIMHSLHQECAA